MVAQLKPKIFFGLLMAFVFSCNQNKQVTSEVQLPEKQVSNYVEEVPDPIYSEHVRTSKYQSPEEEMADFILPPGFEVTLFASEPDITKPINMAFDEKGRLWVSQSAEYPIKAGPGEGTDRISILEDTDGDGTADKISHFADDLNIPIGVLPVEGGAVGFSIPNLYRFYDTNGDGVSDKREILTGPFETKDTHGMVNNLFLGMDGWVHASHGFSNISTVAGSDGDSIKMTSGNTFRIKLDGSRVEKTSDGRINPFGSDLDELGYHYSADCHTLPIYQLIWGGNYTQWGKKEPNLGFAPTMMDYGLNSTALSGLVYYTDNAFPQEYQNSFYSGDVVTCRISRSTMSFHGSTPMATRHKDFLVSKDPWFRPVDIKVGPDGALYIADFYNSIIGHYEVPLDHPERDRVSGRIWKITYTGMEKEVIDWSSASMPRLIEALNDPVFKTRRVATDELVERYGIAALPSLKKVVNHRKTNPKQRVQALWALYRLDNLDNSVFEKALSHSDRLVRVHAHRILADHPTLGTQEFDWVFSGLKDRDPHVQRVAAETLVRHQHTEAYEPIIAAHQEADAADTHLRYALKLALFNHAKIPDIAVDMALGNWKGKDAELVALVFSDTHQGIAGAYLLNYLEKNEVDEEIFLTYLTSMARTAGSANIPQVIQLAKDHGKSEPYIMATALNLGIDQKGPDTPVALSNWNTAITNDIFKQVSAQSIDWTASEINRLKYAASMATEYRLLQHVPALQHLVNQPYLPEDARVVVANALMDIDPINQSPLIRSIMANADYNLSLRQKMASALGRSQDNRVRNSLAEGIKNAPIELQETIAAILVQQPGGKTKVIELIREGLAPARILKSRNVEEQFLAGASDNQVQEFESLTDNLLPISEERQDLIDLRLENYEADGLTVVAGKTLYEQHCSMCHQVDNDGGLIGPQLDGIGNWGLNALAVKVLDPNRNISENFRTYTITLKNGQTRSGLFRREEGQLMVMADQTGQEFTISKKDIAKQSASTITLMPDYFSSNLGQDQFNELMSYLLTLR